MKPILIILLVLFCPCPMLAQDADESASSGDFGIGVGMDYGGIGGRFSFRPSPGLGLIAGLGYNLDGLGYNFGAAWRISPGNRTVPYLTAMYGYNGVIVVEGASQYNKTYYGPSIGFGLEFHSRRQTANYFNLELFVPFRPTEFTNDLNAIKNSGTVIFKNEPWPVAISLGYHWAF